MQQFRLNKYWLLLPLLMTCFQSRSQEVLNNVSIEKAGTGAFKVQYKLNPTTDYQVDEVILKIYRRRNGAIDEVFSGDIRPGSVAGQRLQTFSYNWKPANGIIIPGDELQAKIVLSAKSVVKQKPVPVNKLPRADAGDFVQADLPVTRLIPLNGSRSRDEDGRIISAQWKQIAGPSNLTIHKKDSLLAYLNGTFREGTYAFELTVKDDKGAVSIGRTMLTVKQPPVVTTTPAVTPVPKKEVPITTIPKKDPPETSVPKKENPVATVPKKEVVTPSVQLPPSQKSVTTLKGGPSNAALNLLVPGLGHYFVSGDHNGNNRKASAFVITAAYAGSLGGALYFKSRSDAAYKKYDDLAAFREYLKDANGNVIGVRGANEAEANKMYNEAESFSKKSLISLGIGGGILAGDLIYTLIKGNRNKNAWKQSSSFKPNLFILPGSDKTTVGIQFKF